MSQLQVTGEAKIRDIQGPVVANSGVITALDGAASQYVRGDGTLADFPTSTGGGSSVSYYLNSSVSQGTIGGVAYRELSKDPIIGAGTDITISANGYVANYITDANDPDVTIVPGGNFNCEFYFSVNNNTGNPTTYAELYKYDGTTFTLLGTSAGVPESINQGTTIAPYYFAIPVATAALSVTDRLAIRIYVSVDGRTVTLHTENGHLCQVVTTLSKGMVSLNNLTDQSQYLTTGTSGTNFNIVSSGDTHTFNLPVASATNTGKLSNTDWSTFNNKLSTTTAAATYVPYTGATSNVDLGTYAILANAFAAQGNGISGGVISLKQNGQVFAATGSAYIGSESAGKLNIYFGDSGLQAAILDNSLLTVDRTYNLPDASGTLALTSNLSSYVPYTGATTNVDLGTRDLTSRFIYLNGIGTTGGNLFLRKDVDPAFTLNYTTLYSTDNNIGFGSTDGTNTKKAIFSFGSLTNNTERTYTLPDLSGTLALLEGTQTFSGSKTFSANPSINAGGQSSLSILSSTGNSALILGYVNNILKGTIDISATEFKLISAIDNILKFQSSNNFRASLIFSNSADYSYTFPNATGTIALTSNLSSYVPYSGATGNVDLGSNHITSATIVFWKGTGSGLGNIGIGRIVPLGQNTTGQVNIGIGENSLFYNTTGSNNIALGGSANGNNTTGSSNIGIGSSANYANTTASNNIAIGLGALANNTVDNNVAIGHVASYFNTTGNFNVAVGYATLYTNTTGSSNTAIGSSALYSTTTGVQNTAIGKTSMFYNTTGGSNTAIGTASLQSNTTGSSNTGIGTAALGSNTTGIGNIAIGNASGFAIITGSNNTIIGNYAGTSAMSNNIVLADGAGNIRYQWNGTNNVFGNPISGTSATFSSTTTATAFIPSGSTIPTNGMYLSAANTLNFATNSANRFTIASDGVATFGTDLYVNRNIYVNEAESGIYADFHGRNSTSTSTPLAFLYGSAGTVTWNNGGTKMTLTSAGALQLVSSISATSATLNGNVIINSTATALSPLQVVATGTIVRLGEQSGTTGKQFLIGIDATSGRSELQSVWQGTAFTSLALQPSGGNVLIGTTGDNGAKLQVNGAATLTGALNLTYATPYIYLNASTGSQGNLIFNVNSSEVGNINVNNSFFQITNFTTGGWLFKNSLGNNVFTIANNGQANLSSTLGLGGALSGTSATFSSSVAASTSITVTNSGAQEAILSAVSSFADGYRATLRLNNTHTGGKRWELYSTNNSDGAYGGGKLAFVNATDSTTAMVMTSGGNVGIGTSSPQERFEIAGLNGNIRLYGRSGISDNQLSSNVYYNGSAWVRDNGSFGAVAINLNPSGVITFNTTSATSGFPDERMRITSSGEILVSGTYNPYAFANRGNITMNGTNSNIIAFTNGSAVRGHIFHNQTDMEILNKANGTMTFWTNDTERMRITSGGQLYFSRNSGGTDIINIEAYTGFTGRGILLNMDAGSDAITIGGAGSQNAINVTSSSKKVIISNLGGSGTVTVQADNSGTLIKSSDSSLKQEDKEYKIQGLAEILQLQPRAYKWLKDIEIRKEEAVTEIGFFADEVNPIIPSAAPKGFDGLYGFNDRAVTAALVKSIQELEARIKQLENK